MRAASVLALTLLAACDADPAPIPDDVRGKPIASAPSALPPEVRALAGSTSVDLAAEAPPAEPPKVEDGYTEVKFETLTSYDYEWSQTSGLAGANSRIPPNVARLDRQRSFVVGYMQPIDFDKDGVKSFLLTNYPGGCCFGMVPRLNEWIEVEMPNNGRVDYSYYDAIKIRGVLEVGEERSGEVVTSLYRMQPEQVEVVEQ